MKKSSTWVQAAVTTILAVGIQSPVMAAEEASSKMEKCYGVVKKGMNECATATHSCNGGSKKDGDPVEWIYLPKGTCNKIVGGTLKKE